MPAIESQPQSLTIRIGTRSSALARWQAEWVAAELRNLGHTVELVWITTSGDAQQQGPIGNIGGSGVFTKEIQRALLSAQVDLAVHSLKDLPTEVIPGLILAAVPERATSDDALVSRSGHLFTELPVGAIIGTGSKRRQTQLRHARPELNYQDIRGNVDTRLKKLAAGEYDAIVLAEAGLQRLGWADQITERLPRELIVSAVGQGALGLETRTAYQGLQTALLALDHPHSHLAVLAERSMLSTLRGGCLAPVGGWARFTTEQQLTLTGVVLSPDGVTRLKVEEQIILSSDGSDLTTEQGRNDAIELGAQVALQLIQSGAERLIAAARE